MLDNVSIDIRHGEFVVLLGRSGSGKSTLLNLIGGLDTPSGGTVQVDGRDLFALSERERSLWRRQAVGVVFQAYNLIPTLTVAENLRLPLELRGDNRRTAVAAAETQLAAVGLAGFGTAFPEELSGGEQQRVAVARALIHRPSLVLADEPTGNLDLETARQVLALLDDLCRHNRMTLVMATHAREVMGLADRVLSIHAGRIEETDP
ncbi:MAG TPA: ABC transporter ATP-binding protein [Gammaproteobacteria bacterium]|nr:ABC transporter ATP-binding protein [Gammaproteobacteria bacterium]